MTSRPTLRDLDLNLLVLFDALMTTRRLTHAAERLLVTQSAASQALGRLRRTFDDELFLRSRAGMMPTPRALELAPHVREALDAVERALDASACFDPMTSERVFRLAFGETSELSLFPAVVASVAAESAHVQLASAQVTKAEALASLLRAEADLVFDFAPPVTVASNTLNWAPRSWSSSLGGITPASRAVCRSHSFLLSVTLSSRLRLSTVPRSGVHSARRGSIAAYWLKSLTTPRYLAWSRARTRSPWFPGRGAGSLGQRRGCRSCRHPFRSPPSRSSRCGTPRSRRTTVIAGSESVWFAHSRPLDLGLGARRESAERIGRISGRADVTS